jgi:GT2 family glycosyltransferase
MINKLYLKLKNLLFIVAFYTLYPKALVKRLRQYRNAKSIITGTVQAKDTKVAVLMLTFNAIEYIKTSIESLNKYRPDNIELIVVDNGSNKVVKEYLLGMKERGVIDKLLLSEENTFFSRGNNIAARLSSEDSTHLLLLNSDVEIMEKNWLHVLLANAPEKGIISFGKTDIPLTRPDGWCFLINRDVYLQFGGINEYYKMNWGLTELTGKVAKAGFSVKAIINPEKYIFHFGQKSYMSSTLAAKFNKMSNQEVFNLFEDCDVQLLKVPSNVE